MNMKNRDYKGNNKKFTNKTVCHKCDSLDNLIKECHNENQRKAMTKDETRTSKIFFPKLT